MMDSIELLRVIQSFSEFIIAGQSSLYCVGKRVARREIVGRLRKNEPVDVLWKQEQKGVFSMDQVKIGVFIAQERKEKSYTQRQLADLLGINFSMTNA